MSNVTCLCWSSRHTEQLLFSMSVLNDKGLKLETPVIGIVTMETGMGIKWEWQWEQQREGYNNKDNGNEWQLGSWWWLSPFEAVPVSRYLFSRRGPVSRAMFRVVCVCVATVVTQFLQLISKLTGIPPCNPLVDNEIKHGSWAWVGFNLVLEKSGS